MKKYLFGAMALPLLFACSSEDFDNQAINNDQFAGIEKVDATLFMDEGPVTRMATAWKVEYGDKFGFAWLGGGEAVAKLPIDGNAWQNHPLTVVNDATRGKIFKPETSIYVGNYFLYYPYDYDTKNIEKIKFNSLAVQPLANGANETWNDVAKNAILIGDKWTEVKAAGTTISGKVWDKAGIDNPFQIFSAFFSNQTALDLTYFKNNPAFAAAKAISGATDINYTIAAGETVGAADIYSATVKLDGAAKSFTYAPTAQPNGAAHNGNFWENKKDLNTTLGATAGFAFADAVGDVITLNAPAGDPVSTGAEGNKGWFWFNSLPVTAGDGASGSNVRTVLTTSYGTVTVDQTLAQCAWAYEDLTPAAANHEIGGTAWDPKWIKLDAADAAPTAVAPRKWDPTAHQTFINQYGNHKGKYAFQVDFSTGVMNNMHITDDAHLQKALKYYIASNKGENVVLNLDGDTNNEFKISKISIALLQTINSAADKVLVNPGALKIIVTQDRQADLGLADKKEVPALNNVFSAATSVYLSKDCDWTWSGRSATAALDYKAAIPVDNMVNSIINEGTASTKLTVDAENIELYNTDTDAKAATTLENAEGATMNITKVTTVKNALTNLGTINVGSAEPENFAAELRAYDVDITNDATALNVSGTINNWGVVGVTYNTGGRVLNYGTIDMKQPGAITLLNSNQIGGNFHSAWAGGNKLGTVKLPNGAPNALVSVANGAENGFIEYVWDGGTTYATPNNGTVKYNTIVVSTDIKFTDDEDEIQYIKFNGTRTQVTNPTDGTANDTGYLDNLKGIIVNANKSIIIEKGNGIVTSNSAHLYGGAAIYQGGVFNPKNISIGVDGKTVTDYLGTWNTDQVVKY